MRLDKLAISTHESANILNTICRVNLHGKIVLLAKMYYSYLAVNYGNILGLIAALTFRHVDKFNNFLASLRDVMIQKCRYIQ